MTDLPLLRQSERGVFKRCNWAWYQQHVVGITPKVEKYKEAADFGTLFHVALADYYLPGTTRGPHPAETWDKLAGDVVANLRTVRDEDGLVTWEDFATLGHDLAVAYVERYQGDPNWNVLEAERRFAVTIPDVRHQAVVSNKGRRVYQAQVKLVGTFDLPFRDLNDGLVKITDHKTAARIDSFEHLVMDEQASTYIAVATHVLREQELIGPKDVVKGMEYNYIKRAPLDTRPRDEHGMARNKPVKKHYIDAMIAVGLTSEGERARLTKLPLAQLDGMASSLTVYGEVSADQSGQNFVRHFVPRTPKERQRQIVRISEEARVMDMVRKGELPVLKTPTPQCKFCKFFDLCELDEGGSDTEYYIKTVMKPYDAYADHRDDAVNSKVTNG